MYLLLKFQRRLFLTFSLCNTPHVRDVVIADNQGAKAHVFTSTVALVYVLQRSCSPALQHFESQLSQKPSRREPLAALSVGLLCSQVLCLRIFSVSPCVRPFRNTTGLPV